MKKFNLNLAITGKKVCTRSGDSVRILCHDLDYVKNGVTFPIVASITDSAEDTHIETYTIDGRCDVYNESSLDLFMADPTHHIGWINISRCLGENTCSRTIYNTKEEAQKYLKTMQEPIATVQIEWYE